MSCSVLSSSVLASGLLLSKAPLESEREAYWDMGGEVGDTGRDGERTVLAAWASGCPLMASRGSEKLAALGSREM